MGVKNDLNEQYRRNDIALRETRQSPKRRFLLRFAPFIGILGFLSPMYFDFYQWGDGDISAVSAAVWQLSTSDKKMVQISEKPLKYLTLREHVDRNEIIETMNQDSWHYSDDGLFERNGQKIRVEVKIENRQFAILQCYIEE